MSRPPTQRHPYSGYALLATYAAIITLLVIVAGTAVKA